MPLTTASVYLYTRLKQLLTYLKAVVSHDSAPWYQPALAKRATSLHIQGSNSTILAQTFVFHLHALDRIRPPNTCLDIPPPNSTTMAAEASSSPVFGYRLWDKDDDALGIKFKTPLDLLLKGELSAHAAAYNINEFIQIETSERLRRLEAYAQSHEMPAEDRQFFDFGGLPPPNATGFACRVFDIVCGLCCSFAPYTMGQDRLFAFLTALQDLPRWEAPESYPDAKGEVYTSTFWKFGSYWLGLEEEFAQEHSSITQGIFYGTTAHSKWRNLQHAMARITAVGLLNCAAYSALHIIKPGFLSGQQGKIVFDYDITAAAEWLLHSQTCEHVYRECMKIEKVQYGDNWTPWAKDQWCSWKTEFEFVAGSTQYDSEVRQVAARAVLVMKQVEAAKTGEDREGT